ncbi:hypothetical protein MNB_SV-13-388 [hydrothermal vent metagenome]|uniref:Uncharacterized protein n=1 Tax=hydrothermal vent metagenome TaxID=652676 RepID=A0A1W1BJR2_9ZZZZ
MNKLMSLLVIVSIFSVAQDNNVTLEGTLSTKELTLYTKLLNSWFGTDVKVVSESNSSVVTLPSILISSLENKKIKLLKSNESTTNVPKRKLSLEVDSSCTTEYGKKIYNAKAGVRYTFKSGLGLETGYKVMNLNSDDIEDLKKIKSDSLGLYASLVMAF